MSIDFETMRVNCIQIHQEVFELLLVAKQISVDLGLHVTDADQLGKHEKTKSWDGMGRFASELYDNKEMWAKLPECTYIKINVSWEGQTKLWDKEKARAELLDCFYQLGGNNLLNQ